jgi:hypothetical protein
MFKQNSEDICHLFDKHLKSGDNYLPLKAFLQYVERNEQDLDGFRAISFIKSANQKHNRPCTFVFLTTYRLVCLIYNQKIIRMDLEKFKIIFFKILMKLFAKSMNKKTNKSISNFTFFSLLAILDFNFNLKFFKHS